MSWAFHSIISNLFGNTSVWNELARVIVVRATFTTRTVSNIGNAEIFVYGIIHENIITVKSNCNDATKD